MTGAIRKQFKALLSMRLPHPLLSNSLFQFSRISELLAALSGEINDAEEAEIRRLFDQGLPPITSVNALSAMFGFNPGFIWSLLNKKDKYYRHFKIPKGKGHRVIQAPRVGLKLIQKWISLRLAECWTAEDYVFGFVSGRSHVDAAAAHCGANWVFSCDIENFFPSTPQQMVKKSLAGLGYGDSAATIISDICCYQGFLAQGSPASPLLSNICASTLDDKLVVVRDKYNCIYTRYADDVVFSGAGAFPENIEDDVLACFQGTPWKPSPQKTYKAISPSRLKVHGLLIDRDTPRLTKGYRKKLRAYRHLINSQRATENLAEIRGHLAYQDYISRKFTTIVKVD